MWLHAVLVLLSIISTSYSTWQPIVPRYQQSYSCSQVEVVSYEWLYIVAGMQEVDKLIAHSHFQRNISSCFFTIIHNIRRSLNDFSHLTLPLKSTAVFSRPTLKTAQKLSSKQPKTKFQHFELILHRGIDNFPHF